MRIITKIVDTGRKADVRTRGGNAKTQHNPSEAKELEQAGTEKLLLHDSGLVAWREGRCEMGEGVREMKVRWM
jgi:hypothetical protein